MIDFDRWLSRATGARDQGEADPISKTLALLGVSPADPLDEARASAGGGPTMARQALGNPAPMPGSVDEQATGGVPGLGTEGGGYNQPGLLQYPVDVRFPGEEPYDATTDEGADATNDPLMELPSPDVPAMEGIDSDATMYRQPLGQQPELPPTAAPGPPVRDDYRTTPAYDPRDADQGPRESGPAPWSPLSPNPEPVTPPTTYGPPLSETTAPPPSPYAPGQVDAMTPAPDRFAPGPTVTGDAVERAGQYVAPVFEPERRAAAAISAQTQPGGLLEPLAGGPRLTERMEQIRHQAAAELGRSPIDLRVTADPGWRARHPDLAAEYDDLQRQFDLTLLGQVGDASRFPRAAKPTVEVLQEQLEAATSAWTRATRAGDDQMAAFARERAVEIEGQLVDARNARLDLEPRIASDVGRRVESLPLAEETADDLAGVGRERVRMDPSEVSGPVSVPPRSISLNAGFGVLPEGASRPVSGSVIPPTQDAPSVARSLQGQIEGLQRLIDETPLDAPERPRLVERYIRAADELTEIVEDLDNRIGDATDAVREADRAWFENPRIRAGRTYDEIVGEPQAELDLLLAERAQYPPTPPAGPRSASPGMTASAGTIPPSASPDRLATVNRALSQGAASTLSGGTGAALADATDPGSPQGEDESDASYAIRRARERAQRMGAGFAVGAVAPALAARGARGALRAAGKTADDAGGGALATFGSVPQGGGSVLDALTQAFPRAASAYRSAAAGNAARMAAEGITPASKTDIVRGTVGTIGYGSMIGPATASMSTAANLTMPLWSLVKEPTRAVFRAIGTRNPEALREPVAMLQGSLEGLGQVSAALWDVVRARGKYAPSPDSANLSQRIADPIGRAVMAALETPGRVWAGGPDAIFGTIAEHAVTYRKAAQLATDAGQRGEKWDDWFNLYLDEVDRVKETGAPASQIGAGTAEVIEAGRVAAERAGFRQPLGEIGKNVRQVARAGDLPVLGNLIAPFFNSPWNIYLQRLERTPVGLAMNTQQSRFDKYYDALVGSALAYGMYEYATGGKINGSGPTEKGERDLWLADGNRPYTTNIGGVLIPNRAFGYAEGLLNAAGEIHDAIEYRKEDADLRWTRDDALARVGRLIKQEPYAAGYATIADMVQFGPDAALADVATRLTPLASTGRVIGTMRDPYEREASRGAGVPPEQELRERWQLGTGQREGLPIAQDVLGRPRENPQQGPAALFGPLGFPQDDPVIGALQEAGVTPGEPKKELGGPPPVGAGRAIPPIPLTPQEQQDWNAARGRVVIAETTKRLDDPAIRAMRTEQRTLLYERILRVAGEQADREIRSRPEFQRRLRESMTKARAS
jgi:hypothetical protein